MLGTDLGLSLWLLDEPTDSFKALGQIDDYDVTTITGHLVGREESTGDYHTKGVTMCNSKFL